MFFRKDKASNVNKNSMVDQHTIKKDKSEYFINYFQDVISNGMDVTVDAERDNIGQLGSVINKFMSNVNVSVKGIVKQMVNVSKAAFNTGSSVDTLKKSIQNQKQIIDGISDSTKLLSEDIKNISEKTKNLTSKSTDAIDKTLSGNSKLDSFKVDLNNVSKEILSTKEFMETLKESTRSINSLTEMINDITSRLDILSINASIEAARAGHAGVGFSVISKEIRALSTQSEEAVNKVNSIVDTVITDMGVVDTSLIKAEGKIKSCLTQSEDISQEFHQISNINRELSMDVQDISIHLGSQRDSATEIKDHAVDLSNHGEPIMELVNKTEGLSRELHKAVDSVLERASFKLDWHNIAIRSMLDMKEKITNRDSSSITEFLSSQFSSLSYVELFYVMDKDGMQITDNIVNPRFKRVISTDGLGEDRRDKDYVKELLDNNKSKFVSDIYVSSASRDLCVTVSILVKDIIIAGDMNLGDFINL